MHTCHLHKDETHASRHAHQPAQERSCRPKCQDACNSASRKAHMPSSSVLRKRLCVCCAEHNWMLRVLYCLCAV